MGEESGAMAPPAEATGLFRALNRGIVLGAVYVALLGVVLVTVLLPSLHLGENVVYGLFGGLGLVAGQRVARGVTIGQIGSPVSLSKV